MVDGQKESAIRHDGLPRVLERYLERKCRAEALDLDAHAHLMRRRAGTVALWREDVVGKKGEWVEKLRESSRVIMG